MNLIEMIANGESKVLELKAQLPHRDAIAKTIIAFANTSGGKLLVGVNDQREILGLGEEDIFDLQDKVASIIFDRCYPNILPEIYITNIAGKLVLVIEVFRGNLLPYYLKQDGKREGTYIRIGATTRKASMDSILELERQKRNISYDEELCYDQDWQVLDIRPLAARFSNIGKTLDVDKLKNLKLLKDENGKTYPANALLILLGQYEHVRMKCARFKGTNMEVFLDRKEYGGDVLSQLEQAEAFIKNHIHLRGEIRGLQRTDTFELPEAALREALVNAVVHRDYSNHGRDIKVGVYDDIVNIVSPGGFPSTLTAEALLEGRSEVRNKIIARVFKELGYIEQWGSGIKRIKSSCVAVGLQEPCIRERGDFVDVELYRPMPDKQDVVGETAGSVPDTAGSVPDTVTGQAAIILQYLKQHGSITVADATRLLSVKERRARDIFGSMSDQGLIAKRGSARSTHYVLLKR